MDLSGRLDTFPYEFKEIKDESLKLKVADGLLDFYNLVRHSAEPPAPILSLMTMMQDMPKECAREIFMMSVAIVRFKFPDWNPFGSEKTMPEEGSSS